jgi:hypothetical protein
MDIEMRDFFSFEDLEIVEKCVEDMLKGCYENDEGSFNVEIEFGSKNIADIGKAWWHIGNSWTQNHHVLYNANCQDYEIETDCTIDDMLDSYDFKDEVGEICGEIEEEWMKTGEMDID